MEAAIQNKMNFKTFLSPLLRIISFPYNFSTFSPFLSFSFSLSYSDPLKL